MRNDFSFQSFRKITHDKVCSLLSQSAHIGSVLYWQQPAGLIPAVSYVAQVIGNVSLYVDSDLEPSAEATVCFNILVL